MATEQVKTLIKLGLAAMKAGGEVAAKATAEIQESATNPQLKAGLTQGSETAKQWAMRIDQALKEAGGADEQENPIIEAHIEVSQQIRQQAPDDYSRDLGIIAASQLALHYWIASFGTMSAYAAQAGLSQTQQTMKTCADEAKQADEQFTQLANQLLSAG